jgi:hypothetical protein
MANTSGRLTRSRLLSVVAISTSMLLRPDRSHGPTSTTVSSTSDGGSAAPFTRTR